MTITDFGSTTNASAVAASCAKPIPVVPFVVPARKTRPTIAASTPP